MYVSLKRDPHEERYPVSDSTRVHVCGETKEVVHLTQVWDVRRGRKYFGNDVNLCLLALCFINCVILGRLLHGLLQWG